MFAKINASVLKINALILCLLPGLIMPGGKNKKIESDFLMVLLNLHKSCLCSSVHQGFRWKAGN